SLKDHFEALGLSAEASDWLLRVWRAIQFFDDVQDGDPAFGLMDVARDCLVGFHTQPFFMRNAHRLLPLMEAALFKWEAANAAE
ncbi:hypothetical protein, partial [Klebsiella pneumoniae]|uniref:hypothetical protein n=1 Tax=Klebsiella pneumoniae TaxID=573 RepID=UPI003EE1B6CF